METTRVKPSTEPLDSLLCSASSLERGKRLSLPLSLSLSRSSFVSFFLFSCSDLLESSFGGWRRAFPVHWRSFSSRVRRRAWQDDKAHHPCPISSLCPAFKRARNCWAVSFLFFSLMSLGRNQRRRGGGRGWRLWWRHHSSQLLALVKMSLCRGLYLKSRVPSAVGNKLRPMSEQHILRIPIWPNTSVLGFTEFYAGLTA